MMCDNRTVSPRDIDPKEHDSTDADPNFMLSLARGVSVLRAFAKDKPALSVAIGEGEHGIR
jgi:hypothetical protein